MFRLLSAARPALFFNTDAGGGGGGTATTAPPPAAPPATPPPPPPPGQTPPLTEVPAELQPLFNKAMQERVARLKPDVDPEVARKAAEYDKLVAANQTESQRLQGERDAEKARADRTAADLKATRISSSVISEAAKAGALDPHLVATTLANNNAVTIDDAGQVTGADTAVNTLKQTHPYLFGGNASGAGGAAGTGTTDFGGGQGRGGAGETDKGSIAKGAALFEERSKKKTPPTTP